MNKWAGRDRYNLLSKELRNKLKREEKENGIETDMTEVEIALEELRFAFRIIHRVQIEHFVLFVWKFWILQEVSFIQQNKFIIIYHDIVIAFQEKIHSVFTGIHCRYKAKNIGVAVVHENITRLSILFLAGTTGLVPVLLFQCRRRPSFPSWCLKVPIDGY